ncbi:hypothetical protein [Alkalihalobacterium alkalinitrilicum]|uniref:hypothetical protein n=1 Tax=Alkalihalobacterium alkalinitrilicum TaxID=427920 RepID=UPI000994A01C|nr:hypothetical protein [Alkalihalobacterium alkalinitrilicum]
MKHFIEKLFGKASKDSKLLLFGYWVGILFYFIALILFAMQATIGGQWLSVLAIAVGFPIFFRLVYSLNRSLWTKFRGMNKRNIFLVSGGVGLIIVVFIGASLLFSDNLVINASKSIVNGNVQVSIGSLKGSYSVDEVRIIEEGMVVIPYRTTIDEGDVLLIVEHGDKVLWKKEVSPFSQGLIEFYGEKERYNIQLYTEKAKGINVEIIN